MSAQEKEQQRQARLAEMSAELEQQRVQAKPYSINRSATVSSAAPLKHRDQAITQTKRERFESLDLEVLLTEFRAVADTKEALEEEEPAEAPAPEGAEEEKWMNSVGMTNLTKKIHNGKAITSEDIVAETAGFTPTQVTAIMQRAEVLNATLSKGKKAKKGDARDLFAAPEASPAPAAEGAAPVTSASDLRISELQITDAEPATPFFDLSEEDQKQVQCLNLIQLTTLMEMNQKQIHLKTTASQKKKKSKKGPDGVFGINLDVLVERDTKSFSQHMEDKHVPVFLSRIINYLTKHGLDEEGIFRKAGSAARIKTLRQRCDDLKGIIDFEAEDARPHDVSALLKQFLRETPEPLLTDEYIEAFAMTQHVQDQLYSLQLLVMLLPEINRKCLRILLDFLALVSDHQEANKMGVKNLAVVFAPTLFYVRGQKGQKMLKEVEIQVSTAATLKTLIEFHDVLWNVPVDILAQIRFVNESRQHGRKASKPKDVKRLLTEKQKKAGKKGAEDAVQSTTKWVSDSTENPPVMAIISVTKGDGSVLTDVKVTAETRVAHILKLAGATDAQHLSECGGNIGLRKLNATSLILPLLKVNPSMSLVVMTAQEWASTSASN